MKCRTRDHSDPLADPLASRIGHAACAGRSIVRVVERVRKAMVVEKCRQVAGGRRDGRHGCGLLRDKTTS